MGYALDRLKAVFFSPVIRLLLVVALLVVLLGSANERHNTTSLEKRISSVLSQAEGVDSVNVIIRTQKVNEIDTPCGAVVLVQGTEDPVTRMEMMQALCALLGLQASDVSVIGYGGGR